MRSTDPKQNILMRSFLLAKGMVLKQSFTNSQGKLNSSGKGKDR